MRTHGTAGHLIIAVLALVLTFGSGPAALTVASGPLLWQGRLDAHQVWLFGTIHVPDARVLALPPVVQQAFDRADRVVTEIPLDGAHQVELASALLLPDGQRLRAIIGEAQFSRLETRVRVALARDAPEVAPLVGMMLDRLKPWAALAQLASLDYLPELLAGKTSLDAHLYGQATAAGKQVGGLETIAEQAGTFDAFSPTEQAALLDEALRDLESPTPSTTGAALVEWYVEGNGEKLAATLSQGSGDAALARKFQAEVLVKRNHRMADRIDALRRAAPGERLFVAVGALHLVGPDNLPQLLGARGYDISRVRP
ncbi:TraB/GumN family protein [Luteitalea sp.]